MIDSFQLGRELEVFYKRPEMHLYNGLISLLDFITSQNLKESFHEMTKLIEILITIGMTTSEAERCFSALNRIKTFLRNSMGQDRLNSLCMLAIERTFINSFSTFKDKIIDSFVRAKNRRMDFILKHL